MKLSQIIFKMSFLALAVVYLAVLSEFLSPQQLAINFDIKYDVLLLTSVVLAYIYVFIKRART